MKHRLLALFALGIGLFSTPAYATPESQAAATFLLFAPSARAAGMGNAYVAIADDANATYYNPAALASLQIRSLSTTLYKPVPHLAGDIFSSFGAYTHPFSDIGNLGYSLIYSSLGEQQRTDEEGTLLGTFKSYGMALGVSYGTHLFKNLALGITVKFIYEHLSDAGAGIEQGKGTAASFAGDLGLMWSATDRLSFGSVLHNVGPNMTFIDADQADPLPQSFVFGFAYKVIKNNSSSLMLTADVYKLLAADGFFSFISGWNDDTFGWKPNPGGNGFTEFDDMDYRVGAEWMYQLSEDSAFALRSGYSYDKDGKRNFPTFGLGLKYNWANFDISYFVPTEDIHAKNALRFTGGFIF